MRSQPKSFLLGGALIITGTVIGAGMFALPTAMSGVWYFPSLVILALTWFCMMTSGLMILEVNTHYDDDASFPTMVKDVLGPVGNTINGLSLAFVLYILTYAYITSGGGLTQSNLNAWMDGADVPYWLGQTLFFVVLASCVWISTHWVTRLNAVMIGGMVITFFLACGSLLGGVKMDVLTNVSQPDAHYWMYAWPALPVALASFGFHGNVPSLRKYFQGNARKVVIGVFGGTLLALIIYILWQTAVLGNLPRSAFAPVIAKDGDLPTLIQALTPYADTSNTIVMLSLFMYFAIATSFLGVTLGLFDFIADLFGWDNSLAGKTKTAAVTFLPPFVLSLLKPDGFVTPIGYAGLAATIWVGIIPAMMLYVARKKFPDKGEFRVPGGNVTIVLIMAFAIINIVAALLVKAGIVPFFNG